MKESTLNEKYIKFIVIGIILFVILFFFGGIYSLFHLVLHLSILHFGYFFLKKKFANKNLDNSIHNL